ASLNAMAIGCMIASPGPAVARVQAEPPSLDGISVQPSEIVLHGARAKHRLLVTGRHRSSLESDLTAVASFESLDSAVATVSHEGVVAPRGPGRATVVVRVAGHEQ